MRFPHTPDISALNPVLRCYFYGTASKHHQELSEKDIYIMMKLAVDRIRTMLELKPSELRKELERLYSQ
jgi:hypothetical protein